MLQKLRSEHINRLKAELRDTDPRLIMPVFNAGLVKLEEKLGNITTVVNCARVSTGSATIDKMEKKDIDLVKELLAKGHGTPFEHLIYRWRVIAPITVLRQWMRHRIGTFNEYSQRYRTPIPFYYIPNAPELSGIPEERDQVMEQYINLLEIPLCTYFESYDSAISNENLDKKQRANVREYLRNLLPLSIYSEIIWTVNFRSLMNFFALRRHEDAQYEIKTYADAIYQILRQVQPQLMQCLEEVEQTKKYGYYIPEFHVKKIAPEVFTELREVFSEENSNETSQNKCSQ